MIGRSHCSRRTRGVALLWASLLAGKSSGDIVLFVTGEYGLGVLFGYLFWPYGLEAAMMAHGSAHY